MKEPETGKKENTGKSGYSIGWAKLSGGILKNHYPKGLRKTM